MTTREQGGELVRTLTHDERAKYVVIDGKSVSRIDYVEAVLRERDTATCEAARLLLKEFQDLEYYSVTRSHGSGYRAVDWGRSIKKLNDALAAKAKEVGDG